MLADALPNTVPGALVYFTAHKRITHHAITIKELASDSLERECLSLTRWVGLEAKPPDVSRWWRCLSIVT